MTYEFTSSANLGASKTSNSPCVPLWLSIEDDSDFWHITTINIRGKTIAAEVSSTRLEWYQVAEAANGLFIELEAQFADDLFAHVYLDTEGSGLRVSLPDFLCRKFARAHLLRDENLLDDAQGDLITWIMDWFPVEEIKGMTCRSICALERAISGVSESHLCYAAPSQETFGPYDWSVTVYRKGDRYLVCAESEAEPLHGTSPFSEISAELFECIAPNPDDPLQTMLDFAEAAGVFQGLE